MTNLILAIFFSSVLYIVFKFFSRFKINTFQAIVFNYCTAFSVGMLVSEQTLDVDSLLNRSWILGSFLLGVLFILVFNILGKTSQENGVSVASVSSKMSMIIPILFGIFFFQETVTLQKTIGIGFALIAVYFTSKKETGSIEIKNFILPILLFLGAGVIDTSMNYMQQVHLNENEVALFSATTFLSAFLFGVILSFVKYIRGDFTFEGKNIIGGLSLGIPNYFSLYFLIRALQNKNLESATIFTLINIGVILLSTFFGILLFKEKLIRQNYLGIALAIIAVILVTL